MENGNQFSGRRPGTTGQQWGQSDYGNYQQGRENRVSYMPDNDDNRYGGAYSSDYGYQGSNHPDRYGNTSYGKQYYEERERMRHQRQQGAGNMYENDYGRRDYNRSQLGHNYGSGGTRYQNQGYGSSADQYRSDYGGAPYGYAGNQPAYDDRDRHRSGDDRNWWDRTRDRVASWFGDDDAERRRNTDRNWESGEYRGKGPKGYQRSAARIQEDVCERLAYDDRIDASDIEVTVEGNDVILSGYVHSKDEKRRAEDLVENISGVKHVENRLRVSREDAAAGTWGQSLGL